MKRHPPQPELMLVPQSEDESDHSDHSKLMAAYRKLAQQLDAALERIRQRRSS